jgi:electron transfer flavoprotein beta subunit
VVAGQSSEDYEAAQVGPQVAEILDWPHVSLVTEVSLEGDRLRIRRDAERTKEDVSLDLPAVLVVLSGRDGEQRHPTLRGMMQAKKKSIPVVAPDLEPRTRLTWSEPVAEVREATGTILRDVPAPDAARQLVAWLRERKLA